MENYIKNHINGRMYFLFLWHLVKIIKKFLNANHGDCLKKLYNFIKKCYYS